MIFFKQEQEWCLLFLFFFRPNFNGLKSTTNETVSLPSKCLFENLYSIVNIWLCLKRECI